jgi:hypothetical protein
VVAKFSLTDTTHRAEKGRRVEQVKDKLSVIFFGLGRIWLDDAEQKLFYSDCHVVDTGHLVSVYCAIPPYFHFILVFSLRSLLSRELTSLRVVLSTFYKFLTSLIKAQTFLSKRAGILIGRVIVTSYWMDSYLLSEYSKVNLAVFVRKE